jgi:hypothetical protein
MADNGTDKQQPTQALRNPLEDAKRVVEMLRSDGTIDETYKQARHAAVTAPALLRCCTSLTLVQLCSLW